MPGLNLLSPPPVTRRMSLYDHRITKLLDSIGSLVEIQSLNADVRISVIKTVSIYLSGSAKTKQHVNLKKSLFDSIKSLWLGGAKVNIPMNDLEAQFSKKKLTLEESLSDILEAQGFSSIVQWGLRLCCCRDNQTEAIIEKVTETIIKFKSSQIEMTRDTHKNDGFSEASDNHIFQYSLK